MTNSCSRHGRLGATTSRWYFALLPILMLLVGCPAHQEPTPEAPPVEPDETAAAQEDAASEQVDPDEDAAPGHLSIRTLYSAGGPEAERGLYRVTTLDGETARSPTRSSSFDLPPGRYEASVEVGSASASETVEVVSDERTEIDLVLNAGVLQLTTYLAEGGEPAPNPMYRILSVETDIRGDRETVVQPTRSSSYTLPEGSYIARVSQGSASVDQEVNIEAGERHEVDVILNAGLLEGTAVEEDGSEVERALWRVLSAEEDISGNRETVAPNTRSSRFMLPAGDYLLRVSHGGRTVDQTVTVEAGERHEVRLTMPPAE